MNDMAKFFAEQEVKARAAMAAHKADCKQPTCDRCERWTCIDCTQRLGRNAPRCSDCETKNRRATWLAGALDTVPARSRDVRLDAPWLAALVGPENIAKARQNVRSERVTFVGKPGGGKTSLAAAMFHELVATSEGGWRARHMFVCAYEIARARRNASLGEEAPLVTLALSTPLLVIDELGGEESQYASAVYEVIHQRYGEQLPTWITTGVGPKELAARYGGGIARRLFEGAVGFRLGATE